MDKSDGEAVMRDGQTLRTHPENLRVERRDERYAIEVPVAFTLHDGPRVLQGVKLSRSHLIVVEDEHSRLIAAHERDVVVRVRLSGFDLVLPLLISGSPATRMEPGVLRFDIVAMEERTAAALVQLIRTSLTGWLPNAEDLAKGWDAETPQQVRASDAAPRASALRLPLLASFMLLALGIAVGGYQLYTNLTSVQAEAAAVSAPRYDIVSPEYGLVADGVVPAGSTVTAGQFLLRVDSAELEAALALEAAADDVMASAPISVQGERALGRLQALRRRSEALSFVARCTCTVLWTATPGSSVAPGSLLMSLVASDPAHVSSEVEI